MAIRREISFREALDLTLSRVPLMKTERITLNKGVLRVLGEDVISRVDSPSEDCSLRDGYAVRSNDLDGVDHANPVKLKVIGDSSAGKIPAKRISKGLALRITTGGPLPIGSDAVLMEEYCQRKDNEIMCFSEIEKSRHILKRGSDILKGEIVFKKDTELSPAGIGLLAAAGIEKIQVYRIPRVVVIATGNEVVMPGKKLPKGKLYASNMVGISSWLLKFNFPCSVAHFRDDKKEIINLIKKYVSKVDAFITCGGAWGSERDLILDALDDLHWKGIYHKVKMSPGKGTGFGLLNGKPFFILPGNPSANEIAFLEIALPGLMRMRGLKRPLFPVFKTSMGETLQRNSNWTGFIQSAIIFRDGKIHKAMPIKLGSRLKAMAEKNALIIIPEGTKEIKKGENIYIQLLSSCFKDFTDSIYNKKI